MANSNLFAFQGNPTADPSAIAGLQQYAQQGQAGLSPGQQQIATTDPIAAVAQGGLGGVLGKIIAQKIMGNGGPQQMSSDISDQSLAQGAMQGSIGPTQQNLSLANALQQNPFSSFLSSYGIK